MRLTQYDSSFYYIEVFLPPWNASAYCVKRSFLRRVKTQTKNEVRERVKWKNNNWK